MVARILLFMTSSQKQIRLYNLQIPVLKGLGFKTGYVGSFLHASFLSQKR